MKNLGYILITMLLLNSCAVEPQPINYGQDACDFCKMNIVDQQHAAELVSSKGKAYKFDAIECMMNYLNRKELNSEDFNYLLVANYNKPGELIDAKTAAFIKSEDIPSPMGAFLSGVPSNDEVQKITKTKGGEVFEWTTLKDRFKVK